jgi:3-hydroxyisobutyrate dehydrogenase
LIDTLGKGAGSSWYFVNRAPNMVRGTYPAGFRVRLHDKDLHICREMAEKHGVQLPVIEMTLVHYRRLIEQGFGDEDISSLFRLKAALFDAKQPPKP